MDKTALQQSAYQVSSQKSKTATRKLARNIIVAN